jgi:hypothetical protein
VCDRDKLDEKVSLLCCSTWEAIMHACHPRCMHACTANVRALVNPADPWGVLGGGGGSAKLSTCMRACEWLRWRRARRLHNKMRRPKTRMNQQSPSRSHTSWPHKGVRVANIIVMGAMIFQHRTPHGRRDQTVGGWEWVRAAHKRIGPRPWE